MWAGAPASPYSQMVFENGEPCWQGGSRSTEVGTAHVTHMITHANTLDRTIAARRGHRLTINGCTDR